MSKILTDESKKFLIENGYLELPQLKINLSQTQIDEYVNNSNKIFNSDSGLNDIYNDKFQITTKFRDELADFCSEFFNIEPDLNDIYTITRLLKSFTNSEAYRGHFDSHIFTLVTPVCMPKANSTESGQLLVFPKIRNEPKNELSNFLGKMRFYKYRNAKDFKKLLEKKKFVEFDFKNLNPILFFGRQSFHGNRSFTKQPDGIRITLLTHFFDPSPVYGIGNLLRKLRNR